MPSARELPISESVSGSDSESIYSDLDDIPLPELDSDAESSGDFHHDRVEIDSSSDEVEPILAAHPKTPVKQKPSSKRTSTRTKNQIADANPTITNSKKEKATTNKSKGNGKPDVSQETKIKSSGNQNAVSAVPKGAARTRRTGRKTANLEDQHAATEGSDTEGSRGAEKPSKMTPKPRNTKKKNATTEGSKGAATANKTNPKPKNARKRTANAPTGPDLTGLTIRKLLNSLPRSTAQANLWGDDPVYDELVQKVGTFIIGLLTVGGELSARRREQ